MKRRDLIKELAEFAKANDAEWVLAREGGKHSIYSLNHQKIPIPRHSEIGETLAAKVRKQVKEALGR